MNTDQKGGRKSVENQTVLRCGMLLPATVRRRNVA
jgi:hypothetical protein